MYSDLRKCLLVLVVYPLEELGYDAMAAAAKLFLAPIFFVPLSSEQAQASSGERCRLLKFFHLKVQEKTHKRGYVLMETVLGQLTFNADTIACKIKPILYINSGETNLDFILELFFNERQKLLMGPILTCENRFFYTNTSTQFGELKASNTNLSVEFIIKNSRRPSANS